MRIFNTILFFTNVMSGLNKKLNIYLKNKYIS